MSQDIKLLGNSIEDDIRKANLKELLDQQEKNVEMVTDNITGLSFLNQFKRMYSGIQDYFLIKKVSKFLFELSSMSAESRVALIDKINEDPIYGQKFGTFLITALDRHDFENKSVMLARVCKYYESGYLSRTNFVRFKGIIEHMDIEDLVKLQYHGYDIVGYPQSRNDISLYQFQTLGLTSIKTSSEMINDGSLFTDGRPHDRHAVEVNLTKYGQDFILVINDYLEANAKRDKEEAEIADKHNNK